MHAAGYPVLSLRQPHLFPAPNLVGARLFAGLGVPDLALKRGLRLADAAEAPPRGGEIGRCQYHITAILLGDYHCVEVAAGLGFL